MGLFGEKKKKIMEPDIQVMMLGATRAGKTCVLASMKKTFGDIINDTNLSLSLAGGNVTAINEALDTMQGYFLKEHKPLDTVEETDDNRTPGFAEYDLKIDVSNRDKTFRPRKIRFIDCAGEWINTYEKKEEEMGEHIEKSSVIIIAIDSVLLMEKNGIYNRQNHMLSVTNFIKNYMKPGELINGEKMVLFVPLKCEKYYYQDNDKDSKYFGKRMTELKERVKDGYSELLAYLCNEENRKYFTVAIMPVLTLGGIEFKCFTNNTDSKEISSNDIKYSYCDIGMDKYSPKYCEQPLIFSLLYEQKKIDNDYYKKAFKKSNNKKKKTAKIKEWYYEKRNWATDEDYSRELKKLIKNYQNSDRRYVEIIQQGNF